MKLIRSAMDRFDKAIRKRPRRPLPRVPASTKAPSRPISFVVVRFSEEFDHNIAASRCFSASLNQLVVVDNTATLRHSSLPVAINVGLDRAEHELIIIANEDVYLQEGWQSQLEKCLAHIELHDQDWGIVGVDGIADSGEFLGHWSDPNTCHNSFRKDEYFAQVNTIGDRLILIRRANALRVDPMLPGFHGLGTDLALQAQALGKKCYVVNAPCVYQYRDAAGTVIQPHIELSKTDTRVDYRCEAIKKCCDEYLHHKWGSRMSLQSATTSESQIWNRPGMARVSQSPDVLVNLDSPVILLSKGGGGSRLLSTLAQDYGIFLGTELNVSGDCLDMVVSVYQGVIEKYHCKAIWQQQLIVPQLREAAAQMLSRVDEDKRRLWGFKLPENLFLLPELRSAFPDARYVHMLRNPISTCLRRTHMTARLDNQIGLITLPLAYRSVGRPVELILKDSPALHMAYTTLHQLRLALDYCRATFDPHTYLELHFEDLISNPKATSQTFGEWLGFPQIANTLSQAIDVRRSRKPRVKYPPDVVHEVTRVLGPLQEEIKQFMAVSD